jgi:hypothetical protein
VKEARESLDLQDILRRYGNGSALTWASEIEIDKVDSSFSEQQNVTKII